MNGLNSYQSKKVYIKPINAVSGLMVFKVERLVFVQLKPTNATRSLQLDNRLYLDNIITYVVPFL